MEPAILITFKIVWREQHASTELLCGADHLLHKLAPVGMAKMAQKILEMTS